jgi:hypothetical protein
MGGTDASLCDIGLQTAWNSGSGKSLLFSRKDWWISTGLNGRDIVKEITIDAGPFRGIYIFHGGKTCLNDLNPFAGIMNLNHIRIHALMNGIYRCLIPHLPTFPRN